jgi:predicted N-formylglutamate amidohydrolase
MYKSLIISCEHAGNFVPHNYKNLFEKDRLSLYTHRSIDFGALEMGRCLQEETGAEFYYTEVCRLLVEANRSLDARDLFSEFSDKLPEEEKEKILRRYYHPYRDKVEEAIKTCIHITGSALHFSVHSFTPILNGDMREADIGILYDPARKDESCFAESLAQTLNKDIPGLIVRHNEPYKGTDDGFIPWLRGRFPEEQYTGIELEINQKFPLGDIGKWDILKTKLAKAIACSICETV